MPHGTLVQPRLVAFLVLPPVDLLNLTALSSVFSSAKMNGRTAYVTTILSPNVERTIRGAEDTVFINCTPISEHTGPFDTLIALGGTSVMELPHSAVDWVESRLALTRRIAIVGSASFALASAGVLNGKRITTHWRYAEALARKHPSVKVDKDTIFVKDGNLYSTAGHMAGIDMALSMIEEDLGHAQAISIAKDLIVYMRRPGTETQCSTMLAQQADVGGTRMRDLPSWAKARITQRLDVSTLARAAAMAPRTFARQFANHFHMTPARWVQSLRVEAARTHLEAGGVPLKMIASLTGFRDEQALRRAFTQLHVVSPREYRDRVGKLLRENHSRSQNLLSHR
ncbi:GlxA family transcriptional regulator [Acidipila sp. EB88]|uniref:GlxA family transcriptional regulator n=1 Tax=Acidipila sp. EB88 TaxID=2305226 RepID=UPI000F5E23C6|nr:helix-turn-helix domain-containing protein [Acidipila sp. EB88]RRA49289.1 helix-turn-helix domain-containing protein [Acidipila sp. EB88]